MSEAPKRRHRRKVDDQKVAYEEALARKERVEKLAAKTGATIGGDRYEADCKIVRAYEEDQERQRRKAKLLKK